jgi:hypothetical protein
MTKILERAIAKARELSEEDQDAIGAVLLSLTDELPGHMGDVDEETRAAINEGIAQARRGQFVPNEDIEALWERYGVGWAKRSVPTRSLQAEEG